MDDTEISRPSIWANLAFTYPDEAELTPPPSSDNDEPNQRQNHNSHEDSDTFVIDTNFDPDLPANKRYKHRKDDAPSAAKASTQERTRAAQAYVPKTLEEFHDKACRL